ncbi:hypothetical protein [Actinoplanes auranticolor]|uniref:hypothetical protein n=1 Tax=Actinoplanes auranticolor TaxID=47988 RepID=UPI001BB3EBF6|nr:hypothetical protein [Actinoplanes auranticolor]
MDLAVIAENYGQMTGVLAGFAFTALVLLLTPTQAQERAHAKTQNAGVPLTLFIAFIALVLTTLLYSVLAGENAESRPRAATVELINGLVFGLAVVMLLHGVSLLMLTANIERSTVRIARFLTVVVIPTLAMYFIAQGASDTVAARAALNGEPCVAAVPPLGLWLSAAAALTSAISLSAPVQRVIARYSAASRVGAPLAVFVATVMASIISGFIGTRSAAFIMSPTALNLYLIGAAVTLITIGLMLSASSILTAPSEPDEATTPNVRTQQTLTAVERDPAAPAKAPQEAEPSD